MAVVAVGDYDPARVEELIRERFGKLAAPTGAKPRPAIPVPGHDSTLLAVASDPEQTIGSLQVIYKHPPAPLSRLEDYRTLLVRRLYNQMLNGRFNEIVRRPDAPFVNASSGYGQFVRTSDVYILSAAVRDTGIERGLEAILREAKRVDQHGFLPAELERAKASLLRGLEAAYLQREQEESSSLADEYVAHFLTQEPSPGIAWEFATARQVLPSVTLEEVNALGRRWITDQNRVIAVAAPEKPGLRVPPESQLLAVFRRVDGETVTAWTETVSEAPLVASPPAPGPVVSESRIEELDLTDWRLSNGVRVLVKPTDFKADEVHMTSWSPGGLSLVTDEDHVAGVIATAAADRGGLGEFPAIELGKKMAGKRASVGANIGTLSESINGGGSPRDLELMLQLAYLRMTAPRRDSAAFEAFRSQIVTVLANRGSDPGQVFSDTIGATMGSNHPRSRPITAELIGSVKYDRALEIYRERFADASDFTFLFVGNVNVDSLRPLVERWLGALPSLNRREQWRDLGMRGPEGVVEKTVRKGVEPKASTVAFFSGDAEYTPANRYAIRSLSELLEMKLLEKLREDLGSTYSVSVGGQVVKNPRQEYQIVFSFESAPDRADTLFRAILDEIARVKAEGVSEADVQKVREQQTRTQEVSLKENGYWLGNIAARVQNGEDPRGLLTYQQDFIQKLTGDQIRDAAQRFLNTARYARFVLLPERPVP
jgi:zinc protease